MLTLSSLVTSATQSPEEIQAMEAERLFSDKHNASLEKSLHAQLRQTMAVETVNLVNGLPTLLIQIALLGFAVWLVLKPGGNARPGDVVAVLLLAPMLMSPIQTLSSYLVMASTSWPNTEKIINILESRRKTEDQPGAPDTQLVAPTIEARGISSVGRAPRLQRGGRRFESGWLHPRSTATRASRTPAGSGPAAHARSTRCSRSLLT